jgi:hypothetical protein
VTDTDEQAPTFLTDLPVGEPVVAASPVRMPTGFRPASTGRTFTLTADSPLVGHLCPGCRVLFAGQDEVVVAWVGMDPDVRASSDRVGPGGGVVVHEACAIARIQFQAARTSRSAAHEIQGMVAVPQRGVPWAVRLRGEHPAQVARAAGALNVITRDRTAAYMAAYQLLDAGLLAPDPDTPPAGGPTRSALRDAIADRLFHSDRLWVTFTNKFGHLGGPTQARELAAEVAASAVVDQLAAVRPPKLDDLYKAGEQALVDGGHDPDLHPDDLDTTQRVVRTVVHATLPAASAALFARAEQLRQAVELAGEMLHELRDGFASQLANYDEVAGWVRRYGELTAAVRANQIADGAVADRAFLDEMSARAAGDAYAHRTRTIGEATDGA